VVIGGRRFALSPGTAASEHFDGKLAGEPIHFFIPLSASVRGFDFQLVAVWTARTDDAKTSYRQAHEGLDRYGEWITSKPTVLMGDFNANAGIGNGRLWRDLAARLERLGLVSSYHHFFREEFGNEKRPTHFFKGKKDSPCHLDYCVVPADWRPSIESVEVGAYEDWSRLSDHGPLITNLRFK
jgi:endonuclease/exonuclease/phosphatase family metal-dependent hydrolase